MSVGCSARVTQEQGIWQPIAFRRPLLGVTRLRCNSDDRLDSRRDHSYAEDDEEQELAAVTQLTEPRVRADHFPGRPTVTAVPLSLAGSLRPEFARGPLGSAGPRLRKQFSANAVLS
jgi:hypothetical protein